MRNSWANQVSFWDKSSKSFPFTFKIRIISFLLSGLSQSLHILAHEETSQVKICHYIEVTSTIFQGTWWDAKHLQNVNTNKLILILSLQRYWKCCLVKEYLPEILTPSCPELFFPPSAAIKVPLVALKKTFQSSTFLLPTWYPFLPTSAAPLSF